MSDDKRGEVPDEDADLSCDHDPPMLLKMPPEEEKERSGELLSLSCNPELDGGGAKFTKL